MKRALSFVICILLLLGLCACGGNTATQIETTAATEPPAGSTNSSGQVYVPGFGYVDNSGENTGIKDDDMYENGNKIGIMGGN